MHTQHSACLPSTHSPLRPPACCLMWPQVEDRQAAAGSMGYLDFMQQLQKMLMSKAG